MPSLILLLIYQAMFPSDLLFYEHYNTRRRRIEKSVSGTNQLTGVGGRDAYASTNIISLICVMGPLGTTATNSASPDDFLSQNILIVFCSSAHGPACGQGLTWAAARQSNGPQSGPACHQTTMHVFFLYCVL